MNPPRPQFNSHPTAEAVEAEYPLTMDEIHRRAEIRRGLEKALRRLDSRKPDSLGDMIFRALLALGMPRTNTPENRAIAEQLLTEATA